MCDKSGHCAGSTGKHTPIVSRQQQKLFGAVAAGKKTKATGLSKAEAERPLKESKGKNLPETIEHKTAKRMKKVFHR